MNGIMKGTRGEDEIFLGSADVLELILGLIREAMDDNRDLYLYVE